VPCADFRNTISATGPERCRHWSSTRFTPALRRARSLRWLLCASCLLTTGSADNVARWPPPASAATPPRGLNSWDSFLLWVAEDNVTASAVAMAHTGMVDLGWRCVRACAHVTTSLARIPSQSSRRKTHLSTHRLLSPAAVAAESVEAPALNNDAAVAAAPWGRNRRSMRAAACTSFDSTTRKPFCRCFVQSTSTTTPSTVWPASLIVTFTRFFSVRRSVPSSESHALLIALVVFAD
jgi:hypothetical protein